MMTVTQIATVAARDAGQLHTATETLGGLVERATAPGVPGTDESTLAVVGAAAEVRALALRIADQASAILICSGG